MTKTEYKRTSVYQQQRPEPKQLFIDIGDIIAKHSQTDSNSMLDIGGASGDLAGYLNQRFNNKQQYLLEYDAELVELAKLNYPEIDAHQGDAEHLPDSWRNSFDITTMVGVLSIFDSYQLAINEAIRVTKAKGTIVIAGQFNNYPVDALIHWRYSDDDQDNKAWQKGYNLFSKQSISKFLNQNVEVSKYSFSPFMVPFDLEKQEDPIRTWTELDGCGNKIFRNGLMPINLEILTITLA